ncbi:MAG: hypothetical protein RR315_04545 [Oscillospiraceae bacterium]
MCSEWKITSNFIGSFKVYAVYRLKDIAETDHSGNREFATVYLKNKELAADVAEKLNQEAAAKKDREE